MELAAIIRNILIERGLLCWCYYESTIDRDCTKREENGGGGPCQRVQVDKSVQQGESEFYCENTSYPWQYSCKNRHQIAEDCQKKSCGGKRALREPAAHITLVHLVNGDGNRHIF